MITNDIQQLLDGSLSDEQAAELLHTLSVSPEKRVAFQQHLALSTLMGEDRAAIGLSSAEQAAVWGNIGAAVGSPSPESTRRTTAAGWLTRGAALLTAGVIGYLLGSISLIAPSTTELAEAPGSSRPHAAAPAAPSHSQSSAPATIVRDSIIYRDRIVYRDRVVERPTIVYRDRLVSASDRSLGAAVSDRAAASVMPHTSGTTRIDPPVVPPLTSPVDPAAQSHPAVVVAPPAIPNSSSKYLPPDSSARGGGSLQSPSSTPAHPSPDRLDSAKPARPSAIAASPNSSSPSTLDIPVVSALTRNGLELSAGQRIGMMLPVPEGIDDPDGEYTYYNADVAWRFGEGAYNVGARAIYGTFSAFSLEEDNSSLLNFVDATPSLEARKKFWVEAFAGYRVMLTSAIAIGAEVSAGGSQDHYKVGGNLLAMAMFNDQWGVQLGGGFGRYWFDMTAQREKLFDDHQNENVGIRATARDRYNGPILEGRYGIFFKF